MFDISIFQTMRFTPDVNWLKLLEGSNTCENDFGVK